MKLTLGEFIYLGICLEGFFYGLYSGIFAMYLQQHTSKCAADNLRTKNIIFYALCVLYILSLVSMFFEITIFMTDVLNSPEIDIVFYIQYIIAGIIDGCRNFISQSILIYRCWIVWGCNIRVVIIPLILAITSLATWTVNYGSMYPTSSGQILDLDWGRTTGLTSLAVSIPVNPLVTALIVFRIFKAFREVKLSSDEQTLGATGRRKLFRSIIFILIESGMALFSIQLAWLVLNFTMTTDTSASALDLIAGIQAMFIGITPTIILVRVSMGLSFHDGQSMEEITASLCFAPDRSDSIPETGNIINIVRQESRDNDIDIQLGNDI